ncbi:hypothetical protein BDB01DRAFT_853959 [Pilobolus umbonatus]|nr:hypothetical protein BDB01DRAFT_853959 [Pilobolus umbonatus]
MDYRQKYKQCKHKNEQLLLNIRKLENSIEEAERKIEIKRQSNRGLRENVFYYEQLMTQQREYQQKLRQIIQSRNKVEKTPASDPQKIDLIKVVPVTFSTVCTRVEGLINKQAEKHLGVNRRELENTRHLLSQLSLENDRLDANVKKLMDYIDQSTRITRLKKCNTASHTESEIRRLQMEKMEEIRRALLTRKKDCDIKARERDRLMMDTKILESKLNKKIRDLHINPDQQHRLSMSIRVKAGLHQVTTEHRIMEIQRDHVKRKVAEMQNDSVKHTLNPSINKLNELHKTIKVISATNDKCRHNLIERVNEMGKSDDQFMDRIDRNMDGIRRGRIVNMDEYQLKLKSQINKVNELEEIKSLISPYTPISNYEMIIEVGNMISKVNEFTANKDTIPNLSSYIHSQLQSLIHQIQPENEKEDISSYNTHQLIQYMHKLRENKQAEEKTFIASEGGLLRSKLEIAKTIKKELDKIKGSLNER